MNGVVANTFCIVLQRNFYINLTENPLANPIESSFIKRSFFEEQSFHWQFNSGKRKKKNEK